MSPIWADIKFRYWGQTFLFPSGAIWRIGNVSYWLFLIVYNSLILIVFDIKYICAPCVTLHGNKIPKQSKKLEQSGEMKNLPTEYILCVYVVLLTITEPTLFRYADTSRSKGCLTLEICVSHHISEREISNHGNRDWSVGEVGNVATLTFWSQILHPLVSAESCQLLLDASLLEADEVV